MKKLVSLIAAILLVLGISWVGGLNKGGSDAGAGSSSTATTTSVVQGSESDASGDSDAQKSETGKASNDAKADDAGKDSKDSKGGKSDAAKDSKSSTKSSSATDASAKSSSKTEPAADSGSDVTVTEDGQYTSKEEVALYIHLYGHVPSNYITKTKARNAGWVSAEGNLWDVLPGMSIGGGGWNNDDGEMPDAPGRQWYECDINYNGGFRGAERLVYSNDGLIFYTDDHYESYEQLY